MHFLYLKKIALTLSLSFLGSELFAGNCTLLEGEDPGVTVSLPKLSYPAIKVDGLRKRCQRVPVSFGTIRLIENLEVAITYKCEEVSLYTTGWLGDKSFIYPLYHYKNEKGEEKSSLYKCSTGEES